MATIIISVSSALIWFFFVFFFSFLSLTLESVTYSPYADLAISQKTALMIRTVVPPSSIYLRATSSEPPYLSVTKGLSPDIVYGMYHCRVDITKSTCGICVRTAITEISKSCTYQKEAFIFYEECMVRYSDYSFFGLQELGGPNALISSPSNFPITSWFGETLPSKMNKLITRAASTALWPKPYFVQDQRHMTEFGSSYLVDSVVQCSPDLDPGNRTVCLRLALQEILDCCSRSRSALNFLPKCLVKFNTSSLPSNVVPSLGVIKG